MKQSTLIVVAVIIATLAMLTACGPDPVHFLNPDAAVVPLAATDDVVVLVSPDAVSGATLNTMTDTANMNRAGRRGTGDVADPEEAAIALALYSPVVADQPTSQPVALLTFNGSWTQAVVALRAQARRSGCNIVYVTDRHTDTYAYDTVYNVPVNSVTMEWRATGYRVADLRSSTPERAHVQLDLGDAEAQHSQH